ncbi:MAG: bifunctional folylpolyglutamate synthase/dihydrofolate synthase [Deltaproteobacteria bacterium]|nr:bifunctional folylpolyglutamate synthase/dihydrofolate synthase [Deltaproteobacteria bacterium]
MDDRDTLPFLDGLQRTGIRPGLTRIRRLLARLGHPERAFPSVLITGTNGKGSTAAFLAAILAAEGREVGLFTSPHLVDVRERVRIGGALLPADGFAACGEEVRAAGVRVTYFEALTAIGFLAFARAGVDVAVVEVGMGGRLDSTNTIAPLVSVLTNVSMDHSHFLGDTLDAIAAEKVEVARRRRPFVTAVADGPFDRVVGPRLAALAARPLRLGRDFRAGWGPDGTLSFTGRVAALTGLCPSLAGAFQADNAACALAAAEALREDGLGASDAAMRAGIAAASWPGRMQRLSTRPDVILDGCHNPGAADRLAETLLASPPARPLVLVHASRPDKDFRAVLGRLAPLCDAVVETSIPGLAEPAVLAAACRDAAPGVPVEAMPDLASALARGRALAGEAGTVLIAGSLYLAGAVLRGGSAVGR